MVICPNLVIYIINKCLVRTLIIIVVLMELLACISVCLNRPQTRVEECQIEFKHINSSVLVLETLQRFGKRQISLTFVKIFWLKCTKIVGKWKECNVYAHFISHKAWHAKSNLIKKTCDTAQIYLTAPVLTTTGK